MAQIMKTLDELKEELIAARRILAAYDSPFPDLQEKLNRTAQLKHVNKLQQELDDQMHKDKST